MFRRIITLAGAFLAGAVLLVGPSSAASASPAVPEQQVTISVSFVVTDDDDFSNPQVSSIFSKTVFVSAANPRTFVVFKSACAGDEVRGELALQIDRLSNGAVFVQDSIVNNVFGLRLYEGQEGTGCPFADLDGQRNLPDFSVNPFFSRTASASVGNQQEGGADFVSVSYTVTNITI
jgi:hypothetical protein